MCTHGVLVGANACVQNSPVHFSYPYRTPVFPWSHSSGHSWAGQRVEGQCRGRKPWPQPLARFSPGMLETTIGLLQTEPLRQSSVDCTLAECWDLSWPFQISVGCLSWEIKHRCFKSTAEFLLNIQYSIQPLMPMTLNLCLTNNNFICM